MVCPFSSSITVTVQSTFGNCSSTLGTPLSLRNCGLATIESHLSAITFSRRISRGFEIDTTHPVLASALKRAARSHADVGNQAAVRQPISWAMLLAGETLIPALGNGGHVLWLALCASLCFLARKSHFAETFACS